MRRRTTVHYTISLHAERGLVELDLVVTADLVGQFLPGGCDGVGAFLGLHLAGESVGQNVLGGAVVLEDAGDTRLDRRVRMVVTVGFRLEVRGDERLVVAGRHPFRNVEMRIAVGLETGRI